MATDKTEARACRYCGAPLSEDDSASLCLRCALGNGLEPVSDSKTVPLDPAELTSQSNSLQPTITRFGDYELLEEIARGGMGVVYKARQISLDRVVAVKMILFGPLATADQVRRFRTEASAAGCLQHPNIAAVHEVGLHGNQHYLVMDYVDGPNLGRLVADRPLPAQEAARYVKIIAEAVHYAHERGILHRDLKPSNVLIDSEDRPRVVDFGLAKRFNEDSSLTLSGHVLGSPSYMPPEQAGAGRLKVGRCSDVYSLGAILYYLLTVRPPFQAETVAHTLAMVANSEPLPPRLLNPAVPRDLETICLKCLEKDPAKRYPTAQSLADELGRFIRQEPIQARPITRPERAWRWCRRKPALASLLALVNIVGALGFAGIVWQWRRAEHNAVAEAINRHAAQQKQVEAEAERERARAEQQRADQQARKASENEQRARRLLYISDMNLAQQALRLDNLGKARRLLDRHRPQPGEEDLRGWEWRYLWQLTRSGALLTLTNQPTPGFSLSFSPDGSRLAIGWFNGHVDLWDVPGRRFVHALTDRAYPHQGRVAFSPVRNLLAATSEPRTITLYDVDSGQETVLWRAPDQGPSIVRDLAFSQDGSKVVIFAGFPSNFSGPPDAGVGDAVWIVDVVSRAVECRYPAGYSSVFHFGAARLSPDNRRLYLARGDSPKYEYSIQCLDLANGHELWQTETQHDYGLTTLAVSPDGRFLASGSGFEDPSIRVWDADTGRMLVRLDGHTAWVCHLEFSKNGRTLISSATDQTIRLWETHTWTEAKVLRGHADEVYSASISQSAQLIASTSKDGHLVLWKEDGTSEVNGYKRLPGGLQVDELVPLNHSGVLLLPRGESPQCIALNGDSSPSSLPGLGSSADVLGVFGTNLVCRWDGHQILIDELAGGQLVQRGALSLESKTRPVAVAYHAARQLLAWSDGPDSNAIGLANLATPGQRMELKSDVPGLIPLGFSQDGNYLAAAVRKPDILRAWDTLRAWNTKSGQIVASVDGVIRDATFAAGGRVLVASVAQGIDHKIWFCDLAQPDRPPRLVPGQGESFSEVASPDGSLVASSTTRGQVRLFDPDKGELIASVHGHLNAAFGLAFSPDGRRLISASGGRESVKLWDVDTRQELLTLSGTGSLLLAAAWNPDGDVILAGPPWQAWRAPSWEEIAAAEAMEKSQSQR
jgi:WD40 repeat protein/predicted Ser/Thr protein kinase